jgi:ParB family chromosome partitioning protein
MMMSIDEMAENAKRLASGEVVVELDPNSVDGSFVRDRLGDDADAFVELRNAIEVQGQSTPILVRPHPETDGRYMVVFGHRRLEVAKELGRPVRAIVKELESVAHVILQGQENSARADLTFIERALFAAKLQNAGQSKDVIKAALTIDDTLLSRMLSITDGVPLQVIEALGPQKGVGRDRWETLKKLLKKPQARDQALVAIAAPDFENKPGSARFDYLLQTVRRVGARSPRPNKQARVWQPDATVKAEIRPSGKSFSLVLESSNAKAFGEFISSNLDELYCAFKARQTQRNTGA